LLYYCRTGQPFLVACLASLILGLQFGMVGSGRHRTPQTSPRGSSLGVWGLPLFAYPPRPNHPVLNALMLRTLSGLHLGKWFHRTRIAAGIGTNWSNTLMAIFLLDNGTPWRSLYIFQQFLYLSLPAPTQVGSATCWRTSFGRSIVTNKELGPMFLDVG
jgi:hypothetical protein